MNPRRDHARNVHCSATASKFAISWTRLFPNCLPFAIAREREWILFLTWLERSCFRVNPQPFATVEWRWDMLREPAINTYNFQQCSPSFGLSLFGQRHERSLRNERVRLMFSISSPTPSLLLTSCSDPVFTPAHFVLHNEPNKWSATCRDEFM